MKKKEIAEIIKLVITFIIAFGIFSLGLYIHDKGSDITNFCDNHYRNESFLKGIGGDSDDPQPINCVNDSQWRTNLGLGFSYCNSTCFKAYDKCLDENATDEQIRFSYDCHWMGPDWFILVGTLMFGFFIPAMTLIILGVSLKPDEEDCSIQTTAVRGQAKDAKLCLKKSQKGAARLKELHEVPPQKA